MHFRLARPAVIIAFMCGLLFRLPSTAGATLEAVPEKLLVEVIVNGVQLNDYYDMGRTKNGTLYLPAAAIFSAGELVVEYRDPQRLEIFLESTGEGLVIDLKGKQVTVASVQRPLGDGDILQSMDGLLISEALLKEAFDMDIRFDSTHNALYVRSRRPWPRDLRLAREMRWRRAGRESESSIPPITLDKEYQLFGTPQMDVAASLQRNEDGTYSTSYNAFLVSEACYLTNRIFASGGQGGGLTNLRLQSGRTDPRGGVFGIAKLYDLQAGDISGMNAPLVGSVPPGVGVRFQAGPLTKPTDFDQTEVQGDALPGWDAELYLDQNLYDFQRIGANGRYHFKNIPLSYGMNQVKVILYGPNGQTREDSYLQSVGSRMLRPGEVNAYGYVADGNARLFNLGNDQKASGISGISGLEYGLSRWLTVGLFGARVPLTFQSANGNAILETGAMNGYYGVELRPLLGRFTLETGLTCQTSGGLAAFARFTLPFRYLPVSGRHEWYSGTFSSSANVLSASPLRSRTILRVGLPLNLLGIGENGLNLTVDRQLRRDGSDYLEGELSYSHRIGPVSFHHQLDYSRDSQAVGGMPSVNSYYRCLVSYRQDAFDLRGELNYRLKETSALQTLDLTATWRKDERSSLVASATYTPSGGFGYGLSWHKDMDWLTWSLSAYRSSTGDISVSSGVSFSLGYAPSRGFTMSNRAKAEDGLVDLLVFNDVDGIGRHDPDLDQPLAGVELLANGRRLEKTTLGNGRLQLDGQPTDAPLKVEVLKESLPDPFLVPTSPPVLVWPRPGQVIEVPLGATESGEISGSLSMVNDQGKEQPLRGVRLQLLNAGGDVQAETLTFSDGTFLFDTAYPGHWSVRVAPGQVQFAGKLDTSSVPVELTRAQRVCNDINLRFLADGSLDKTRRLN
jgi:hypothetical protein